jgi:hypothetical protein
MPACECLQLLVCKCQPQVSTKRGCNAPKHSISKRAKLSIQQPRRAVAAKVLRAAIGDVQHPPSPSPQCLQVQQSLLKCRMQPRVTTKSGLASPNTVKACNCISYSCAACNHG